MSNDVARISSSDAGAQDFSRAETILAALQRAEALLQTADSRAAHMQSLVLHIVGADQREGSDLEQAAAIFAPLFQGLRARYSRLQHLYLLLIGPNVHCTGSKQQHTCTDAALSITITYSTQLYHEMQLEADPDLIVLFNAGLWGYSDWQPTLISILTEPAAKQGLLLVTSYCGSEAEDDFDVLEAICPTAQWLWEPELNPHRSLHLRAQQSEQHVQYENHHWQCIKLCCRAEQS